MMLTTSDTINEFAAAMAKVQSEIGGAVKGSLNPAFKSKYADLSAVWEAFQQAGPKNGIAILQFPGPFDGTSKTMLMEQIITHSSGQWMRSEVTIPLGKLDAHGYGSAATYARRYALAAAVGICPEDDDGNASIGNDRASRNAGPPDDNITPEQCAELRDLAEKAGVPLQRVCGRFRVPSLPALRTSQFGEVKAALLAKVNSPAEQKEAA